MADRRATLLLLPGLDGTDIFFRPLVAALPPWIETRCVLRVVHLAAVALRPSPAPRGERVARAALPSRVPGAGVVRTLLVRALRSRPGGVLVAGFAIDARDSGAGDPRRGSSQNADVHGAAALPRGLEGHRGSPLECSGACACDPVDAGGDHRRPSSGPVYESSRRGGRPRGVH